MNPLGPKEIQEVIAFATLKHMGQTRKYTNEPYVNHPLAVGEIVGLIYPRANNEMRAGAILHDVLEDTDCSFDEIAVRFGIEVASLAHFCTNWFDSQSSAYTKQLCIGPEEARVIKCADILHNNSDILIHGTLKLSMTQIKTKLTMVKLFQDTCGNIQAYHQTVAYLNLLLWLATKMTDVPKIELRESNRRLFSLLQTELHPKFKGWFLRSCQHHMEHLTTPDLVSLVRGTYVSMKGTPEWDEFYSDCVVQTISQPELWVGLPHLEEL